MTLLDMASDYNTDNTNKKRKGTMKRIGKYDRLKEGFETTMPESVKQTQESLEERSNKVNSLLEKMTTSNLNDDSSNTLADYNPLPNPSLQNRKDFPSMEENNLKYNPNQHDLYSNYNHAYNGNSYKAPQAQQSNSMPNDKLLEKINYMIHMLEQQQHEKTENITEEFILYGFLGVFVIYVCDSFTRSGKYIR
jgi:hypothetical protein